MYLTKVMASLIGKFLLERKSKKIATTRSQHIQFRLEDMVYLGKEVFLVLEIRNRSEIDFEVGCVEVLRVNGTKKRRASYQEVPMAPTRGPGVPKVYPWI